MSCTDFLTPEQFAERLGVPTHQIRRWINVGQIPAIRLGRRILVPSDALERLLDADGWSRNRGNRQEGEE